MMDFVNFDFSKIDCFETFIEYAKMLETDKQKIEFISAYFDKCVSYNYQQIFWGYIMWGVKSYSAEQMALLPDECFFNKKYADQKPSSKYNVAVIKRTIETKEDCVLDKIIKLKEKCKIESLDDVSSFYGQVLEILMVELKKRTTNPEILNLWYEEYEKMIVEFCCDNYKIIKDFLFTTDITARIIEGHINYKKWFPNLEQNGMIKTAVCLEYSKFIEKYLTELGIQNCKIEGISNELKHAWNMVLLDGKIMFVDLNREIFIRDNYGNIPLEQKGKWKLCTLEEMFKMQPTRVIQKIGDVVLKPEDYITVQNYNDSDVLMRLNSYFSTSKKQKK